MNKKELLNLEIGKYDLTDSIDNYKYELFVIDDNGKKYFKIKEKGSLSNNGIWLSEDIEKDEDGNEYDILYAIMTVGGLSFHSTETFSLLNVLKILSDTKTVSK